MLEDMHPMDILRFCKVMFPNLYQSTAFGLTGLATMDMLSKIQKEHPNTPTVDLIFLDTLYHFKETHDLVDRVKARYPNVPPDGVNNAEEFEDMYGKEMWNTASEMYDWIVKVEPLQRAYDELKVAAVLNGRRRSQGAARGSIPIIEIDDERGVVDAYIKENNVPYNALLDQGYKSVGDWHSTVPVKEGEDERAGRWKGQDKTECGIHNKQSRYSEFVAMMERKQQEEKLAAALEKSGFVTTSSCAGRVSVFLEGRRVAEAEGEDERVAGVGGKGAGGAWLFVSHDPIPDKGDGVTDWSSQFGLEDSTAAQNAAPTILHVLTASPEHAQILLRCGLQAGFRESGALNIVPSGKDATTPMVAIRTMGLAFESLIGQQVDGQRQRIVSPEYLQTLVDIANERFDENKKRIERFQNAFREAVSAPAPRRNPEGQEWEDAAARRERKRAEGLRKRAELKAKQEANTNDENELSDREGEKQVGLLF
ncbi:unnamed protein product [Fusarium graminearum]|nr:unnamed protein product [Fusarium graminearum]